MRGKDVYKRGEETNMNINMKRKALMVGGKDVDTMEMAEWESTNRRCKGTNY